MADMSEHKLIGIDPAAPGTDETMYCIVSIKWSGKGQFKELVTFWGPNNNGYTIVLEHAGKYKAGELRDDIKIGDIDRSRGTERSFAVPVDLLEGQAMRVVEATSRHMAELCEWRPEEEIDGPWR